VIAGYEYPVFDRQRRKPCEKIHQLNMVARFAGVARKDDGVYSFGNSYLTVSPVSVGKGKYCLRLIGMSVYFY
jgi:hypothetical protein